MALTGGGPAFAPEGFGPQCQCQVFNIMIVFTYHKTLIMQFLKKLIDGLVYIESEKEKNEGHLGTRNSNFDCKNSDEHLNIIITGYMYWIRVYIV